MVRPLTADEVEFAIEVHPEDAPIAGNCSAIDAETDSATEAWITDQLEQGNAWAWCCVRVVARWEGFEGDDWLGCCSYESEATFCEPGGYFGDMLARALEALNETVATTEWTLAKLA